MDNNAFFLLASQNDDININTKVKCENNIFRLCSSYSGDKTNIKNFVFKNVSEDFKLNKIDFLINDVCSRTYNIETMNLIEEIKSESFNINNENYLKINLSSENLGLKNKLITVGAYFTTIKIKIHYNGNFEESYLYCESDFFNQENRNNLANECFSGKSYKVDKELYNNKLDLKKGDNINETIFTRNIKGFYINNISYENFNYLKIYNNNNNNVSFEINKIHFNDEFIKINEKTFFYSLENKGIRGEYKININYNIDEKINFIFEKNNELRYMGGYFGFKYQLDKMVLNKKTFTLQELNKELEGDNFCPVNHTEIKENDKYLNCSTCNKNFLLECTLQWIKDKKQCPHCKTSWIQIQVYNNKKPE